MFLETQLMLHGGPGYPFPVKHKGLKGPWKRMKTGHTVDGSEIRPTSWYGSLSHCLQGFVYPRWCRISAINSIMPLVMIVVALDVFTVVQPPICRVHKPSRKCQNWAKKITRWYRAQRLVFSSKGKIYQKKTSQNLRKKLLTNAHEA